MWRRKLLHLAHRHSPLLPLQNCLQVFVWLCSIMCFQQSKLSRWEYFDKLADLNWSELESCSTVNWKQVFFAPDTPERAILFTAWGIVFLRKALGGQNLCRSSLNIQHKVSLRLLTEECKSGWHWVAYYLWGVLARSGRFCNHCHRQSFTIGQEIRSETL